MARKRADRGVPNETPEEFVQGIATGSELRIRQMQKELAEPFPAEQVKFRVGSASGPRAMALAYIDARLVMDRLDQVLGPTNWQNEFLVHPDGSVSCTIIVTWPDGSVTHKTDRGVESKTEGKKGAFSDAFKRAAVMYGIGRYLYRLPRFWCDYDQQKKVLRGNPTLPAWALPAKKVEVEGVYADEDEVHDDGMEPSSVRKESKADRLVALCEKAHIPESTVNTWLHKAGVQFIDQLPAEAMDKCIAYAQSLADKMSDPQKAAERSRG